MNHIKDVMGNVYLGYDLIHWATGIAIAVGVFVFLEFVRTAAAKRFKAQADKMPGFLGGSLVEVLEVKTKSVSMAAFALFIASKLFVLPQRIAPWVNGAMIVVMAFQIGVWGNSAVAFLLESRRKKAMGDDPSGSGSGMFTIINFVVRILMWSVIVILTMDNLGIDITALVAGLGIGGIAGALALQNILADLFASVAIVLDKPFLVGDVITVDNFTGAVEYIGIKTTRLRSITGEQIVFSNTDLLKSRVRNFKRMSERRVAFSVGVVYQTPKEKLADIPQTVKQIVEGQKLTRFDRAHLKELGEYSLNFEIVYFVLSADYNAFIEAQQNINIAIFSRFKELGIEFAYPTKTNYQIAVKDEDKN